MEEEYYEELQLQIDVDVFRCEEALQELQAERAARNAIFAEEYEFEYEVDAALVVAEQVAAERKEMAAEQYRGALRGPAGAALLLLCLRNLITGGRVSASRAPACLYANLYRCGEDKKTWPSLLQAYFTHYHTRSLPVIFRILATFRLPLRALLECDLALPCLRLAGVACAGMWLTRRRLLSGPTRSKWVVLGRALLDRQRVRQDHREDLAAEPVTQSIKPYETAALIMEAGGR